MPKSRSQRRTVPFKEESRSPETGLGVVRRLSEEAGVKEDDVHLEMNKVDAQAGQELPRTEDYVKQVVTLIKGQQEVIQNQLLIQQEARRRENVLLAAEVLSKEYPDMKEADTQKKLDLGLQSATNLLQKEMSLLNGAE